MEQRKRKCQKPRFHKQFNTSRFTYHKDKVVDPLLHVIKVGVEAKGIAKPMRQVAR